MRLVPIGDREKTLYDYPFEPTITAEVVTYPDWQSFGKTAAFSPNVLTMVKWQTLSQLTELKGSQYIQLPHTLKDYSGSHCWVAIASIAVLLPPYLRAHILGAVSQHSNERIKNYTTYKYLIKFEYYIAAMNGLGCLTIWLHNFDSSGGAFLFTNCPAKS